MSETTDHDPASRMPSMQDIATAAGVGKATVSLALRNDPRLKRETRDRIQRIAAELGYRSNPIIAKLMVQLRASRSPRFRATLAILNASPDPHLVQLVHTFQRWLAGCKERGESLGYIFDSFWMHDPNVKPARLLTILRSRGIQGLLIFGLTDSSALPAGFEQVWGEFPAVVMGTRPRNPALHFCTNDQFTTTISCMHRLLELGYRRPGMVLEKQVDDIVENRFSAAFWTMQQRLEEKDRVPSFDFNRSDSRSFAKWYTKHKPDVIITLHEEVKAWLEAMNVKIPGEVGLAHLDLEPRLEGWSGMNQNNVAVGSAGLDLLVGQIQRNEKGVPESPKCIMIESVFTQGGTTKS